MLNIFSEVYLDETSEKKYNAIKKKLSAGKKIDNTYCIILSTNNKDLFDIVKANDLRLNYYKNMPVFIMGISSSKENSLKIVTDIVVDNIVNNNRINLREYYQNQEFIAL